jgi:site-specific DNA-methyltransferase (adenine-specific)
MNQLYYGDNLEVLRQHIKDESIDLVYLDPPFNSHQDYNILFAEQDGTRSAAQIKAFEDTWRWDQVASQSYQSMVERGGKLSQALQAFRIFLGESDMLAYLCMMAPRLVDLRRVLKPMGSIYLHCDPTASHYLKMLMDAVFGPLYFRNEIIWKRTSSHNDARRYADVHDCLLYYAWSKTVVWNAQHLPHGEQYVRTHYNRVNDEGRRYRLDNIIRSASMGARPNLTYDYKGYIPPWGWRVKQEKLTAIDQAARLMWSASGIPYLVRFLDEMRGAAMPSIWDDIPPVNSQAADRLGYPTQKPEALLERIIKASSNEGDIVLDPFCSCGTAIASAQRLNRQWIGIDITHLAITLIKHRLQDTFRTQVRYQVTGEPTSLPDAEVLAAEDPYQFQWWALGLVGARPVERKKGADQGIDGRIFFNDEGRHGRTKQVILSVKSGHLKLSDLRDLRGVLQREAA